VQEATTALSQANSRPKDNVNTSSAQSTTPDAAPSQSTTARTSPPAPPHAPQPDPSTELTRSATPESTQSATPESTRSATPESTRSASPDSIDTDVDPENEGTRMTVVKDIQYLDKAPEDEDESEIPKKKRRMRKKEKCYIMDDPTRNRYFDTNMKRVAESVESLGACTGCYGFLYLRK
jgi:hypothetical protein